MNVLSRGRSSPERRTLSRGIVNLSSKALSGASSGAIRFWPTLFGYQLLFELRLRARGPEVVRLTRFDPPGISDSALFARPRRNGGR